VALTSGITCCARTFEGVFENYFRQIARDIANKKQRGHRGRHIDENVHIGDGVVITPEGAG
jgi:hypothetical protein